MDLVFEHDPVMVDLVVDLFAPVPSGVVVDATVGGGGHAEAILAAHEHLALVGLDRDREALSAARSRLDRFGRRVALYHRAFSDLGELLGAMGTPGGPQWPSRAEEPGQRQVVGVLFDLGVSSPQLDRPERGFSYRTSGPLDMRMDPSAPLTAAQVVNTASLEELADMFAASGEGRLARRLARAIVAARPLATTDQLARVVEEAVPAKGRRRGHPARRVFQALRMAVNEEPGQLAQALPQALGLLAVGGRAVVISYHSGEDQLVKQVFRQAERGGCECPPGLPCVCGAVAEFQLVFRGSRRAGADELARNRRAESARLRAIERLSPPGGGAQ